MTEGEIQSSIRKAARRLARDEGISYKHALKKNRKMRKRLRRIARARSLDGLDEKVERALDI